MRLIAFLSLFAAMVSVSAHSAEIARFPITDFEISGSGPQKLLLIPCMSCRWRAFDSFMERNADKYTMYAVTIPGFGGSSVPELPMWSDKPVWHENARAAVLDFVREHKIDNAIVISHSWGSRLAAEVLSEDSEFAAGWIVLDNFVPLGEKVESLSYETKLELIGEWREKYMEPLRAPDEWDAFNRVSTSIPPERQVLYHGMFMATPHDVLFQYWRENALVGLDARFGSIEIPVLEVKSISRRAADVQAAKRDYLKRYENTPYPDKLKTIFLENTGHHQLEERPAEIDAIIVNFVAGETLADIPSQD